MCEVNAEKQIGIETRRFIDKRSKNGWT
jgi:hypothetical protein